MMKKGIVLLLCVILLMTGCGSASVRETFKKAGPDMLQVTLAGQTYDLGEDAASVLDQMYVNGNRVVNYLTFNFYGAGGKYSQEKINIKDVDKNKLIYFRGEVPPPWKALAGSPELETPNDGIQQMIYAFYVREQMEGPLLSFQAADGLSRTNSQNDLSGYIDTGVFGRGFGTNKPMDDHHFMMLTVDGAKVDVSSYLNNMPQKCTELMKQKDTICGFTSLTIAPPAAIINDGDNDKAEVIYQQPGAKEYYAIVEAAYDQILRLNAREIENFALIDVTLTGGQITSIAYYVFKYDSFDPRP